MFSQKLTNFILLFHEAVGKGLLLFSSAIFAMILANSPFSDHYYGFIRQNLQISFGSNNFSLPIHNWINDFLMSIFFLVVGMEIKREMIDGHLRTKEQKILPIVAACFGVIFPVLIYIAFNYKDSVAMKAWATPAATDIAFALGIFAIFGKGLPVILRIFLTALAIIDDFIAVVIIALFYSGPLQLWCFVPIIICCLILCMFNKYKLSYLMPYSFMGIFMWYFFFKSGVHPTISGVLLGLFIPLKISDCNHPLKKFEKTLIPYVEYLILPLFAFSNTGICIAHIEPKFLFHPIVLGIVFGLLVGKSFGISLSVHLLQKLKIISIVKDVKMKHFYYLSVLCGIGFTMSLFIAMIAFQDQPIYFELAKVGIILGAILSTIIAMVMMRIFNNK